MHCKICEADNPEGTKFCGECGTPVQNRCRQCGFENLPSAKFCRKCGILTTAPAPESQDPQLLDPERDLVRQRTVEAERRQLTVMFCDLVGSTALSEQLDPEELREVVLAYQEVCARVISRFAGYIAQYLGDGLLVYFGYPLAHEDDPQRAVRAGLEIIGAVQESPQPNTRLSLPLRVRVGIHTGLVVVGEMGGGCRREQLALGDTPNLAARVQGVAEPGTVVISTATYRLIEDFFAFRNLGSHPLKGITTPVAVYQVLGESGIQSRFEVAVRAGLTPLIGREHEVGLLAERWERAKQGEGQVVLLGGEAGIGKSRLVQTFKEQVMAEGATRIEFRCSPYHQNSAFHPIIEHLQRLLQFAPHEAAQAKLTKLAQLPSHYHFPQAETLPLLASLLSLPHPPGAPPLTFSPQKQKQKTQEALVAWLVEEAERQAVYCAWEDLHWIDPSSLEVLTLLLEQVSTMRLLTVLTFRPDFTPPWRPCSPITRLTLSRLGRPQVEAMVERIAGNKALPAELTQQIISKTDGVPLFVEELTKMVLESGLSRGVQRTAPLQLTIPATLRDSLMARLDRLNMAKEIAQLGATLGREFSYELLHAISPLDEATLQQGLRQLVEAELLYQRGLPPQASYLFKHALVQDVAYQSLLKSKRQRLHGQIARVLEERFSEISETQPELLAHHYTEAGLIAQAIFYWQGAGQKATQRSANTEAISYLTKGLELLETLTNTPERTQQELRLQVALGAPLQATKGYAAPEVETTYARARELCQHLGETPQLFPVLRGLWVFYLLRADLQTAHELGRQLLTLAQSVQDPAFLLEAHYALGATLFFRGEVASARIHLEHGIALYDGQQHRAHVFLYGQDPGVFCHSVAALALWLLGYPEQALERNDEALSLAHRLAHSNSLAAALFFAGWLHQFRLEASATHEQAEAVMALSREQGFPFWMAWGMMLEGGVLTEQGQEEVRTSQIHLGLTLLQGTGAELARPYVLAVLLERYGKLGQAQEGLRVLAEALAIMNKSGERFYEAELYRLKGELTFAQSRVPGLASRVTSAQPPPPYTPVVAEAEACFHQAIEIAQRQRAKSLELRAVMSLSRLWQQQGKREKARQLLAEIYGWFTEGFDTADLQEARTLLRQLEQECQRTEAPWGVGGLRESEQQISF